MVDEIEEYTVDDYEEVAKTEEIVEEKPVESTDDTIEMKQAEKVEQIINVPIQAPTIVESVESKEIPLYDVQGLDDSEKRLILETRIGEIIKRSQIPYIPAEVNYRESPNSPPLTAVVKVDHRCVQDAWDFYKANARNPNATEFFDIVRKFTRNPEDVFTRVVKINLM